MILNYYQLKQDAEEEFEGEVLFYDYDGTLLHEYTTAEFEALGAMPSNPDHTSAGLVSQGWNWTYADALAQAKKTGHIDIGQNYNTSDSATHLFITAPCDNWTLRAAIYGCTSIDYGDGTGIQSHVSGTAIEYLYSQSGDYEVIIYGQTISFNKILASGYASGSFADYTGSSINQTAYGALKEVHLGNHISLLDSAFKDCFFLEKVTIPNSQKIQFSNEVFSYNESLSTKIKQITLPEDSLFTTFSATLLDGVSISVPKTYTSASKLNLYAKYARGFNFSNSATVVQGRSDIMERAYVADCSNRVDLSGLFMNCYALQDVTFENISNLPGGMYSAFANTNISSITIPAQATNCYNVASNCKNLKQVYFENGCNADTMSNSFDNCRSLKSVTGIPTTVINMNNIFSNCISLKYTDITHRVTNCSNAFAGCRLLTNAICNSNGNNNYAFLNCTSLISLNLYGTNTFGTGICMNCWSLKSIDYDINAVTTINASAFVNCFMLEGDLVFNNVTSIGGGAFTSCKHLNSIYAPNASVENNTFSNTQINYITINGCVTNSFNYCKAVTVNVGGTSISANTFNNCPRLYDITFANTITTIAANAIYNSGLKNIHMKSETPPTLNGRIKNGNTVLSGFTTLYVPYSADHSILEAYQTATNWSTYADQMVEE